MKKYLMILLLVAMIPFGVWVLSGEKEINILLITNNQEDLSPNKNEAFTWILKHFRFMNEGTLEKSDSAELLETLEVYNKEPVDLIYLEDTSDWSEGLSTADIDALKRTLYDTKATFISEYHALGNKETRETVAELLSIEHTGWSARYYEELNHKKNKDIPEKIIASYEDSKGNWDFEGQGMIFVHEDGRVVVLESKKELNSSNLKLQLTKEGQSRFSLNNSSIFNGWFDIIQPKQAAQTLAQFDITFTEKGIKILKENNIPETFSAITFTEKNGFPAYYFAGDFLKEYETPSIYQYSGLSYLWKGFTFLNKSHPNTFYINSYVPIVQSILESTAQKELKTTAKHSMVTNNIFKDSLGKYSTSVSKDSFQVYKNGQWENILIKGVNIGMTKPGYWPGDASLTEEDYYRWFTQIGELNANSIRIYTIPPPDFYHALKRYNEENEQPLYLFQGVWIEEEGLETTLDAFHSKNTDTFKEEIQRTIDVVHGNAKIAEKPGHASGNFTADVSPYILGYILGIEWYPKMVENTNKVHANLGDFNGKHITTSGAEAFEYWLADVFDFTIDYELTNYKWMHPISFTNWVTTDLLSHPYEPNEEEDLVAVNPNVITVKDHFKTGQFASYHIYPYYPDFLNLEPKYVNYIDHRGEPNNYAGYLKDLHAAHEVPVLVAEFGVPSSRGLTHENPTGKNQGFLSEKEQGEINASLFEDIYEEGLLGGLLFSWQDEWFKRTWNTMDLDNPDRRPYWSNAQTNEQQFGLLSFDRHKIAVDGDTSDWDTKPIYAGNKDSKNLQSLYMDHDERYLYLRVDYKEWDDSIHTMLLLDTLQGQGIDLSFNKLAIESGAEFLVNLGEKGNSSILVDSYYDSFYWQYAHQLKLVSENSYSSKKENGIFHPISLPVNKELYIAPIDTVIPFKSYESGQLRFGNGNPVSKDYDSLADYYVNSKEKVLEIRIPWLLLSFKDPSLREVQGDFWKGGMEASEFINGINVTVLTYKSQNLNTPLTSNDLETLNILDSMPAIKGNRISKSEIQTYTWEKWEMPIYEERLKQSYYIIQKAFEAYK